MTGLHGLFLGPMFFSEKHRFQTSFEQVDGGSPAPGEEYFMKSNGWKLTILLAAITVLLSGTAQGAINIGQPLEVRILYDNSGSMYPGYRIGGNQQREALGVNFFHVNPEFQGWLKTFLAKQATVNATPISIYAFTDNVITRIQDPVAKPQEIDAKAAFAKLPRYGQRTFLTKQVHSFTKGFEGLAWIITDNIVDTREGTPDNKDILSFFQSINDEGRYRSVHVFRYPISEKGKKSHLAIYSILVSDKNVPSEALGYFDKKISEMADIFPGHAYLKLKDLKINPIELNTPIDVILKTSQSSLFRERHQVRLALEGSIKSNLTQHTVTGGPYMIGLRGPLKPDNKSRKKYHIKPILASKFNEIQSNLGQIQPLGSLSITKNLDSKEPLSIDTEGFMSWIRAAMGIRVHYTGEVVFTLGRVDVELQRGNLAGIYGIEEASKVFDFQKFNKIENIPPQKVDIGLDLETAMAKPLLLLFLLLLLLIPVGLGAYMAINSQKVAVRVDSNANSVSLRRFGSHSVREDGRLLGVVRRGAGSGYSFSPNNSDKRMTLTPSHGTKKGGKEIAFDVQLLDKERGFVLGVEPLAPGATITTAAGGGSRSSMASDGGPAKFPGPSGGSAPGAGDAPGRTSKIRVRPPKR